MTSSCKTGAHMAAIWFLNPKDLNDYKETEATTAKGQSPARSHVLASDFVRYTEIASVRQITNGAEIYRNEHRTKARRWRRDSIKDGLRRGSAGIVGPRSRRLSLACRPVPSLPQILNC